ncbi:heavy metal translocating P-type ATPase [Leucothrix pacifica]|uniref:P-type Cu(2+) transporter n=1 Tax=Leucothrix pacifica TaxID=1247513 RepID=A0A317CQK1_9GAMM|nr:heavy metal translocating P-type ATPase [Leucothrix pacifica]PWR00478.1 cation transporter [Leucothrix pacifica]
MAEPTALVGPDQCYHCGLPLDGAAFSVIIDDAARPMCCLGCKAVAQAIVDNGLDDFYRYRTELSPKGDAVVPDQLQQFTAYDNESIQQSFVRDGSDNVSEASLIIEGIVCAACVWLIEHQCQQIPGVFSIQVNLTTHRATVKWDKQLVPLSHILATINGIGYQAYPFDSGRLQNLHDEERKRSLRRIAIAGIGMMQVMMSALALYIGADEMGDAARQMLRWAGLIITTPVVIFASSVFFKSAWRELKRKRLGMDVPVSLAIIATFSASVWATITDTGEVYFDSVTMFTFFLLLGRYLEMAARHRAGKVADELVRLLPATTTRINPDNSRSVVSVSELQTEDIVLIKPGETVPADGLVLQGESSVNEAMLTGESMPVLKARDDVLSGGTVNIDSPLQMQVNAVGESTVLSSIIRLLDRAQLEKPAIAKLADSVAAWFVLGILVLATLVYSVWSLYDPEKAFWITISVLVVTCPCALSLATPVALTTSTSSLTRMGMLTTRGHTLESLSKVTDIVFDKTGTLTTGQLVLKRQKAFLDGAGITSPQQLLDLAAGLEASSEHPVGRAIFNASDSPLRVENSRSVPGYGVEGRYQGSDFRIGTSKFITEWLGDELIDKQWGGLNSKTLQHSLSDSSDSSDSSDLAIPNVVYLASKKQILAVYELQDQLRAGAEGCIHYLREQGYQTTILSGDRHDVVEGLANQLHVDNFAAERLPNEKLAFLKQLQSQGSVVLMVGDGVNDAPVLAGAEVSVAMGEGSQLAQVTADMVLMSNNLTVLPQVTAMAGKTRNIIRQNLSWALGYNLLALPLAAFGVLAPWMAAIGMSFSSLLVVLNALRLKREV